MVNRSFVLAGLLAASGVAPAWAKTTNQQEAHLAARAASDAAASLAGKLDHADAGQYDISLTLTPAGGEAYRVTMNQYIYPSNPFTQGDNVTVKVDPDDANVVMIFGRE